MFYKKYLIFLTVYLLVSLGLIKKGDAISVSSKRPIDTEIVFIVLSSSNCVKDLTDYKNKITIVESYLKKQSESKNYGFKSIGIANESNISRGTNHLKQIGVFDEIIVGDSWNNIGAIRYLHNDIPGPATVPQIIVTKREYKTINHQGSVIRTGIIKEIQITRVVGYTKINNWISRGIPLPQDLF